MIIYLNVKSDNICCGAYHLKTSLYDFINDDIISLVYEYVKKPIITKTKVPSIINRFNIKRSTKYYYYLTIDTEFIAEKLICDKDKSNLEKLEKYKLDVLMAKISVLNNATIYNNKKECLKIISNFSSTKFDIQNNSGESICTIQFAQYDAENNGPRKQIIEYIGNKYENHEPKRDDKTRQYVLFFNQNRVNEASQENFKISNADNGILLQFGKKNIDNYIMDVCYPFSIEIAFGISLCSFMTKM